MTLDDAIKHCEEVVEENLSMINDGLCCTDNQTRECLECVKEHRQLAEWLKELKKYRAIFEKIGRILRKNGYTMDDLDTIFGKANDEEVNADEAND